MHIALSPCRSTATWVIDAPSSSDGSQPWRMFRIQQTGPNASGQTHYLSLSGFELYGNVTGGTEDPAGVSFSLFSLCCSSLLNKHHSHH